MPSLTSKDKHGLLLLGAISLVFAGLTYFFFLMTGQPTPDDNNCIAPVNAKTVILIDRSDALTEQGSVEITRRSLDFVRAKVGENELVSIFEVTDVSDRSLKPRFSRCKPPATGNRLHQDVQQIEKRFKQSFQQPLESALAATAAESRISPISEALIDLSLSAYLRADRANLIVFSDLMQNSRNASLYNCSSASGAVAEFKAHRAGAMERPAFQNTAVILNIVPREGLGQTVVRCREGFWAWFFGDNPGPQAGLETSYLPGGAALP